MNYTIEESFKNYCKSKHAEDKKKYNSRHYNYMQEVFSQTEMFDISNVIDYDYITENYSAIYKSCKNSLKNMTLPFSSLYVKVSASLEQEIYKTDYLLCTKTYITSKNKDPFDYIFLHEYSPEIITGTLLFRNKYQIVFNVDTTTGKLNVDVAEFCQAEFNSKVDTIEILDKTGNINVQSMHFLKSTAEKMINSGIEEHEKLGKLLKTEAEDAESLKEDIVREDVVVIKNIIILTLNTVCNLPKYSVCADKFVHPRTEYYNRKKEPTIKREQPPIYYILNKSEETKPQVVHTIKSRGKLEFTHSFKVRSHWRRINPTSYGKDRYGNYKVKGMTFVREFIKGEGELAKRLRVVK